MDYQKLVEYRNANNPYSGRQGITVEEIRFGYARAVKTVGTDDLNPAKVPHGGVYFVLADTASAAAAYSRSVPIVTVNCSFNFLGSATVGDCLTAEATEVQRGKTFGVYDVIVKNQNDSLLGKGTFTMYQLPQKKVK